MIKGSIIIKIVKNDKKRSRITKKIVRNYQKIVKNDQKIVKIYQNGQELSKMVNNDQ